jgi:DNA polymerase-3 subunit epsilon
MDLSDCPPADVPTVIIDTETTGLTPGLGHRVVEIAALRLENGREVDRLNTLLQPDRHIDPQASAVNGIADDDLLGQPAFAEIAPRLREMLSGAVVVAHNARFDADFLGMEFFISRQIVDFTDPLLAIPWLCTLQLARRLFHFGRNNLTEIARVFGIRIGAAHRAMNDVYMTAAVYQRMVRELSEKKLRSVDDLLHAQGLNVRIPFPLPVLLPDEIEDAWRTGSDLRIVYQGNRGEKERIITPLYPTQHQGENYLIAYCHLRQAQRTFRLDRIMTAAPA